MFKSEFVVVKHEAKVAGLHYDFRFKLENSDMWASFVVPKGVPTKVGEKVLAIKSPDHNKKDALLTGVLTSGYGAGKFTMRDKGTCEILKFSERSVSIKLNGKIFKGTYHLFRIAKPSKQKQYFLFKGR